MVPVPVPVTMVLMVMVLMARFLTSASGTIAPTRRRTRCPRAGRRYRASLDRANFRTLGKLFPRNGTPPRPASPHAAPPPPPRLTLSVHP